MHGNGSTKLARTPDDDVSEMLLMTAMFVDGTDAGGQPPIETIVTERPRRKPPRQHRVVEGIRDDNGRLAVRITAADGFVLDSVVVQEKFAGAKGRTTLVFAPSRGKPRSARPDLAADVRDLNARRAAFRADHPVTKPEAATSNPKGLGK
jgi:hypothetical protein